jgi:SEC-C motif domain protein
VRSRFSAFALGEGDYLWRTLSPRHELRARDEGEVSRELGRARRELRYRELILHEVEVEGDDARVLFTVRLFARGRDRSFVELSRFERTAQGWRYLDGVLRPLTELAGEEPSIGSFEELVGAPVS